jgi:hypothetical protein
MLQAKLFGILNSSQVDTKQLSSHYYRFKSRYFTKSSQTASVFIMLSYIYIYIYIYTHTHIYMCVCVCAAGLPFKAPSEQTCLVLSSSSRLPWLGPARCFLLMWGLFICINQNLCKLSVPSFCNFWTNKVLRINVINTFNIIDTSLCRNER